MNFIQHGHIEMIFDIPRHHKKFLYLKEKCVFNGYPILLEWKMPGGKSVFLRFLTDRFESMPIDNLRPYLDAYDRVHMDFSLLRKEDGLVPANIQTTPRSIENDAKEEEAQTSHALMDIAKELAMENSGSNLSAVDLEMKNSTVLESLLQTSACPEEDMHQSKNINDIFSMLYEIDNAYDANRFCKAFFVPESSATEHVKQAKFSAHAIKKTFEFTKRLDRGLSRGLALFTPEGDQAKRIIGRYDPKACTVTYNKHRCRKFAFKDNMCFEHFLLYTKQGDGLLECMGFVDTSSVQTSLLPASGSVTEKDETEPIERTNDANDYDIVDEEDDEEYDMDDALSDAEEAEDDDDIVIVEEEGGLSAKKKIKIEESVNYVPI